MRRPTTEGRTASAAELVLLVEGWRTRSQGALARRLSLVLRSRIASGLLPPATRLPPERTLAAVLGVSRATVVSALDELRAEGLVESRQGRGTRVAGPGPSPIGMGTSAAARLLVDGPYIDLAASVPPDAAHLPELRLGLADLASVNPAHGYAPAGLPALREAAAGRWAALGVPTTVEQVHVTHGAHHGLHLALGAVVTAGEAVAVEDPTYVGVPDLLAARGLRPVPVPSRLVEEDPAELVRLCRGARARALLLVPAVHSPTGRVRAGTELVRLAEGLDQLGLPVIEDGTVADLVFHGPRPPSLASLCQRAPVISVESTSKVAWGGLRVGWLRGPARLVERTVDERRCVDLGNGAAGQLLTLGLLAGYDALIASRRAALAAAAARLGQLLAVHLPEWRAPAPAGGLSIWVDIGTDAEVFAVHALRHGVAVAPGTTASSSPRGRRHLRLCFDRPALELDAAALRLARAVQDASGRR